MQNTLPRIYYFTDKYNLPELLRLNKNIDIIYRNYKKNNNKNTLISLKKFCSKTKRKFYLSNDIKTALKIKADGIYIPSFNRKLNYATKSTKPPKFKIIGSAHNKSELAVKKKQKCSEIFVSSIFKNKKNKKFLEIIKFNLLILDQSISVIALGGIGEENFRKLKLTNSIGFASINWIKKNGLSKLRPFLNLKIY